MTTTEKANITVQTTVNAPIDKVWKLWTDPEHVMQWNNASDDWHTPKAENDLRVGGRFVYRMEAKDGSFGFDFDGEYTTVEEHKTIEYRIADGRVVRIDFVSDGNTTTVTETFEAEETHSLELQRSGWQSIIDNFKRYVESYKAPMDKLRLETTIAAPVEIVYSRMLDEQYYRVWTAPFNPSSHYIGSWDKGSKILFIGTDKDGTKGGMVSRIKENIPNQFVSIEHLGVLQGDQEITSGPEVEGWAGALENYTFIKQDGRTLLQVEMDANEEFKAYFEETWPKAFEALKVVCES